MGINFNFDATAVRANNQQQLQDDLDAAHGRIVAVLDHIGASPFSDDYGKASALESIASALEAFAGGQVPMPQANTPAALGAATAQTPAQSPASTPNAPNAAEQQRINELEGAIKDLAALLGISVPLDAGKLDLVRFKAEAKKAVDAKASAPAAVPADLVKKADVKKAVEEAETAAKALKTTAMMGSTINGRDNLLHRLDVLRRAVS